MLTRLVMVVWLVCSALGAHADVWGYIDDKGIAHFAPERVDERYELFSRASDRADGNANSNANSSADSNTGSAAAVSKAPSKLLAFFEVSPSYKQVKHLLREASKEHRIDYELLQAMIATESGFDRFAVSPRGAVGLMQLMPETAKRYGVVGDAKLAQAQMLTDARTNIRAGSRYLRDLIAMFPGQLHLAVAAYNAGEGAVLRAGKRIPDYKETQNYVATVMQLYTLLKPPQQIIERRKEPERARTGLAGGALQRGNMPAPLSAAQAALPAKPAPD